MTDTKILRRKEPWIVLLFALSRFIYSMLKVSIDQRMVALEGNGHALTLHYAEGISLAVGVLIFVAWHRLSASKNPIKNKNIIRVAMITSIILTVMIYMAEDIRVLVTEAILATLTVGFIGGYALMTTSRALYGSPYMGRLTGLAFFIAVSPQAVVVSLTTANNIGILACAIALAAMAIVIDILYAFTDSGRSLLGDVPVTSEKLVAAVSGEKRDKPGAELRANISRELICLVGIMSLVEICLYFVEWYLTHQGSGEAFYQPFYEWTRIFFSIGYLLSGFVMDYLGRHKSTVFVFIAMCFALIFSNLLHMSEYGNLMVSLYYLVLGSSYGYGVISFFELAVESDYQELWSNMQYVVMELVDLVLFLIPMALYKSDVAVQLIGIAGVVGIGILAVLKGDIRLYGSNENKKTAKDASDVKRADSGDTEGAAESADGSQGRSLEGFREQFALTPRECEVFDRIMTTEEGLQEIADDMYISKRVLQRHLTSIYQKCGVESRLGLYQAFQRYLTGEDTEKNA